MAEVTVFPDSDDLATALADQIVARLLSRPDAGPARLVLGCPAGRTPTATFDALVRTVPVDADLSELVLVMMDEYLEPGTAEPVTVDPAAAHSCRGFAQRHLIDPLNRDRPAAHRVRPEHLLVPDPACPARFDDRIAALGGIDLFLLASGASDGHVGFHGPGADPDGVTQVVTLADSTRHDNLATFPHLGRLAEVPTRGVSIGLGTIARYAAEAVLLLTGADKATSARRVLAAQDYDPRWPATVIHRCRNPRIWLDRAAAGPSQHSSPGVAPGVRQERSTR